jgi:hypothetical protein
MMESKRQGFHLIVLAIVLSMMLGVSNTIASASIRLAPTSSELFQTEDPPVEVWVSLSGCDLDGIISFCPELPELVFEVDQFNRHKIQALRIFFEGPDYTCAASKCVIPTDITTVSGRKLEFWAYLEDGETTNRFSGRIRVLELSGGGFRVELVSSQLLKDPGICCSNLWEALPPYQDPPLWLTTPETPDSLFTEARLYFLAGQMIRSEMVNARECPSGGISRFNYANECGMDLAWERVQTWQNRFDGDILNAARSTGVPAWLLKDLFLQESQMWPGNYFDATFKIQHYGLGHLTPLGADTLLLWNLDFYRRFCATQIGSAVDCSLGYSLQPVEDRALIRTVLAKEASAECLFCRNGINLSNVGYSIEIFAETLKANAAQVAQVFWITTKVAPGTLTSYEDMWRFTLANYNSGPVCLYNAILAAKGENLPLSWDQVSQFYLEDCAGAVEYVNAISGE